jgi:hypothetical protein
MPARHTGLIAGGHHAGATGAVNGRPGTAPWRADGYDPEHSPGRAAERSRTADITAEVQAAKDRAAALKAAEDAGTPPPGTRVRQRPPARPRRVPGTGRRVTPRPEVKAGLTPAPPPPDPLPAAEQAPGRAEVLRGLGLRPDQVRPPYRPEPEPEVKPALTPQACSCGRPADDDGRCPRCGYKTRKCDCAPRRSRRG